MKCRACYRAKFDDPPHLCPEHDEELTRLMWSATWLLRSYFGFCLGLTLLLTVVLVWVLR